MIRQYVTIRLQELVALVGPVRSGKVQQGTTAVEGLVHRLALVGAAGVAAEILYGWCDTPQDELHLRVRKASLREKGWDYISNTCVPAVRIAKHDDRIAGTPGVYVVYHLLEVRRAGFEVAVFRPGIRVQVVGVDVDAVG